MTSCAGDVVGTSGGVNIATVNAGTNAASGGISLLTGASDEEVSYAEIVQARTVNSTLAYVLAVKTITNKLSPTAAVTPPPHYTTTHTTGHSPTHYTTTKSPPPCPPPSMQDT